jgi:hypothetical protein
MSNNQLDSRRYLYPQIAHGLLISNPTESSIKNQSQWSELKLWFLEENKS